MSQFSTVSSPRYSRARSAVRQIRHLVFAPHGILIGPVVIALITHLIKQFHLLSSIHSSYPTTLALWLFVGDLPIVGALAVAGILASRSPWQAVRFSALLCAAALLCIFIADTALIIEIDSSLEISELIRFASEWKVALTFLSAQSLLVVSAVLIVSFLRIPFSRSARKLSLPLVALIAAPCMSDAPPYLRAYTTRYRALHLFFPPRRITQGAVAGYNEIEQREAKIAYQNRPILTIPEGNPSVILLIVESLSSVDSLRAGGIHNYVPRLDALSEKGTFFTNFLANHYDSEGGFTSLLNAQPPLPFPSGTRDLYNTAPSHPSVVREFSKAGYLTKYLTQTSLRFLNQGTYAQRIGFQVVLGRDEVPSFLQAPRFTMNAPPDEFLFHEALRHIDTAEKEAMPLFLTLFTTSSHLPYLDPRQKSDREENIWRYVDEELSEFVNVLSTRHYFDRGLLLILGDHHKMLPLVEDEIEKLGEITKARVPLIAIGHGVPRGRIDQRLLSQSDLFPHLRSLFESTEPVVNEVFHMQRFENEVVLSDENSHLHPYPFDLNGTTLTWSDKKPPNFEAIERRVHQQRASLQAHRAQRLAQCRFDRPPPIPASVHKHGLEMLTFDDTEISAPRTRHSPAFLESSTVSSLWIPSFSPQDETSLVFRGYIDIPTTQDYQLRLGSDDGSCLAIDGEPILEANYCQAFATIETTHRLSAGLHWLELRYFQEQDRAGLTLEWRPDEYTEWQAVPEGWLYMPVYNDEGSNAAER